MDNLAHGDGRASPEVRHEPSDVSVRGVLWFAAGLIVFAVVLHFGMVGLFNALAANENARKASTFPLAAEQRKQGKGLPHEPRLEGIEGKRGRSQVSGEKEGYGWADEKAEIARIPIEKAMEKILAEGRLKGQGKWRGRLRDLPSDASSGRTTWGGRP